FSNESASGWQDATLATPIAVQANTTYIASYYAPSGGWSLDRPYFTAAVDNAPLHGLADGTDGSNGVYFQGGSGFPQQTFESSNYWVDVDVATSAVDRTPPTVTSVTPAPGATGVSTSTRIVARFSEPLT